MSKEEEVLAGWCRERGGWQGLVLTKDGEGGAGKICG